MKFFHVILLYLFLGVRLISPSSAQEFDEDATEDSENNETSIYFKIGIGDLSMRDKTISSFVYNGGCNGVNLGFSHKRSAIRLGGNLGLYFSTPVTLMREGFVYDDDWVHDTVNDIKGSEVPMTLIAFDAHLLFKINKNAQSNWSIWTGAKIDYLHISKKFLILDHQNLTKESYLTLNPMLLLEFQPHSRHTFHYGLDASLVGYGSKSDQYNAKPFYFEKNDYYIDMYSVGGFTSFKNLAVVNSNLGYRFQIGDHFALTADYTFSYYRYTKPLEVRMVRQNFQLGVGVIF